MQVAREVSGDVVAMACDQHGDSFCCKGCGIGQVWLPAGLKQPITNSRHTVRAEGPLWQLLRRQLSPAVCRADGTENKTHDLIISLAELQTMWNVQP